MTDEPNSAGTNANLQSGLAEPQLPVFRFGLRHLFWCVTLACLVLAGAVATASSGYAMLAFLLAVLVVGLHLAGTTIGYRLREHADRHLRWEAAHTNAVVAAPMPTFRPSPLHEHRATMPWLKSFVISGIFVGGAIGAAVLIWTIGHRTSAAGILVGAVSTAIVGGWFAFVAGSFWSMFRQGWRDALNDDPTPPRNR